MGNPNDSILRLRLWSGGQFTATLASAGQDRYLAIVGDGRGTVRTATVDGGAWAETATRAAIGPAGPALRRAHVASIADGAVGRSYLTTLATGAARRYDFTDNGTANASGTGYLRLPGADGKFRTGTSDAFGGNSPFAPADGAAKAISVTEFDDGGRQVVTQTDDGRTTQVYDAEGRLASQMQFQQVPIDGGSSEHVVTESYDSSGAPTGRLESLQNKYDDGSFNARQWGQDEQGRQWEVGIEGHDDTVRRTEEVTRADGVVERTSTVVTTVDGNTFTQTETAEDDRITSRGERVTDADGNVTSAHRTDYNTDGTSEVRTLKTEDDGSRSIETKKLDKDGNETKLPSGTDDDWSQPGDESMQPWRMLADEVLGESLLEQSPDDLATGIDGAVAGEGVDRAATLRNAIAALGEEAAATRFGTPTLDMQLDAATAATVNSSLGDLSDAASVRTFVADLVATAGNLAPSRRLLAPGLATESLFTS
ncbi:hypothetical protein ACPPVO_25760 [Dactylosporangium sp. McL0621]|uniref:hypothetical protein n=1 Tax=Dactylosporangium sp. McL0621 TaxID=3415678 RepID=UPI003CF93306